MMQFVGLLALIVLVGLGLAMVWQQRRYLRVRRERVQDGQVLFHSPRVFHVVTFLELAPGGDLFESVRKLRDLLEAGGSAKVIYAGKVALNALQSAQLEAVFGEAVPWDAVIFTQFPSFEAWERARQGQDLQRALAGFRRTYSHGMKRSPWLNLLLPQALLARRVAQIVRREPSHYPFEILPEGERTIPPDARLERLAAERELGERAAVVVNLVLPGTPEQRAADRGYVRRMFGLMAEGVHGPMHMGRAVTLEKDTHFDRVALVYYPGVDYFRKMATSRFYQGILGGKQLGDTQASITVPILGLLEKS